MTIDQFNEVVSAQMELCADTLMAKGMEYSKDTIHIDSVCTGPEVCQAGYGGEAGQKAYFGMTDRLGHFKKAATLMNTTPKAALLGMFSKHIISVSDMCMDDQPQPVEKWNEKITDSINYLLILRALVEEEQNGQN